MSVQCVIFDFDGTLFDSMYVWKDVGRKYLNMFHITPSDDFEQIITSMTLQQAAEYVQHHYLTHQSVNQIMDGVSRIVAEDYVSHILPAKGVPQLLAELAGMNVRMVIATLSEQKHVIAALQRCHLDSYFMDIITAEDVPSGKQSAQIYEKAMAAAGGRKDHTIVVEDAYFAAKTARDAGFTVVGVYEQNETEQEKMKEICDLYVEDLSKWKTGEVL